MPLPSDNDLATLSRADFGETLLVDGVSGTGTFVLGVPAPEEGPVGIDRRRIAIVRVPSTMAVRIKSRIRRVSDASEWMVDARPDIEHGEAVCSCVALQRQQEGRA
jgi:hypothetical protein